MGCITPTSERDSVSQHLPSIVQYKIVPIGLWLIHTKSIYVDKFKVFDLVLDAILRNINNIRALHKKHCVYPLQWQVTCTCNHGGSLHCKVEHHVQRKQNILLVKCITTMDQNLNNFFFMSRCTWYLLHSKKRQPLLRICVFSKTYRFQLE